MIWKSFALADMNTNNFNRWKKQCEQQLQSPIDSALLFIFIHVNNDKGNLSVFSEVADVIDACLLDDAIFVAGLYQGKCTQEKVVVFLGAE